jgi:hypothetical protein
MQTLPLRLQDLSPKETTFFLSTQPDKTFTLCRWSLRVRAWAMDKYTPEGLKDIFEKQKIVEIADMAFFMLKEEGAFISQDDFLDAICTIQDQINLITALLGAVGIGEPEIEKINAAFEKAKTPNPNQPSPKSKKTGAKSLTP